MRSAQRPKLRRFNLPYLELLDNLKKIAFGWFDHKVWKKKLLYIHLVMRFRGEMIYLMNSFNKWKARNSLNKLDDRIMCLRIRTSSCISWSSNRKKNFGLNLRSKSIIPVYQAYLQSDSTPRLGVSSWRFFW